MSQGSNAQDLLLIARDELMKQLLPALPASLRYQALMVANAMAMAARECETGLAAGLQELAGLKCLLQEDSSALEQDEGMPHLLPSLRKRLASEIRQGRFDAPDQRHAAMLAHLAATTAGEVAISNPKLLLSRDAG